MRRDQDDSLVLMSNWYKKAIPDLIIGMAFCWKKYYLINFNSLIILAPPPNLSMHQST